MSSENQRSTCFSHELQVGVNRNVEHVEHVELATLAYVEWFNNRRLHSELAHTPPAEFEAAYYAQLGAEPTVSTPTRT